jgi:C4-dicarboxylate-binding protein DctP
MKGLFVHVSVIISLVLLFMGIGICDEYKARLSYHFFPKHHAAVYADKFVEMTEAATKGRLKIEVFHSGQLYGIRQALSAVSAGGVEMAVVLNLNLIPVDRNFNISSAGFFWPDYESVRRFWEETPEGRKVWEGFQKKLGVKVLCYNPNGPNLFFSTKHFSGTLEDLKGRKSRYLTTAEKPGLDALGMSGVSVGTEEMYTALKQGMIDTLTTVPSAMEAYSWWDTGKYALLPEYGYADSMIIANAGWWNSLPQDIRDTILKEVGPKITEEATTSIMQQSKTVLDRLEGQKGGKVTTMTDEEFNKMKQVFKDNVWPVLAKEMDPEVYQAALKFMGYK